MTEPFLCQAGHGVQGVECARTFHGQRGGHITLQGGTKRIEGLIVPCQEASTKGVPCASQVDQAGRIGRNFPSFPYRKS